MSRIIISLFVGLAAGIVLSPFRPDISSQVAGGASSAESVASVECVCDMQQTLDLERALKVERDTNNLLVAEIDQLQAEIDTLSNRDPENAAPDSGDWLEDAWSDLVADEEPENREQRLVAAGFSPARAEWILRRESQLQMAALQEHQEDTVSGQPLGFMESRVAARSALRQEIGDQEYEHYLAATGQSTTVAVTQVLSDSPAQVAGLQVGDQIIDYDGVRVFNMLELSDRARSGSPDGVVVLNIERKGSPMQLILPRGPLGISGGTPTRY